MKFNIEVDITPEEFKELVTPSEKQAKLWADIVGELSKSIQEQANVLYPNAFTNYVDFIKENQDKFFEHFKK